MTAAKMADVSARHIETTPGVAGGKPRIVGHRISVQNIAIWHERMGLSADEIATEHGLTLADVYAALTYYYDHREEIDKAIQTDEVFVSELRSRTLSKLREKKSFHESIRQKNGRKKPGPDL